MRGWTSVFITLGTLRTNGFCLCTREFYTLGVLFNFWSCFLLVIVLDNGFFEEPIP